MTWILKAHWYGRSVIKAPETWSNLKCLFMYWLQNAMRVISVPLSLSDNVYFWYNIAKYLKHTKRWELNSKSENESSTGHNTKTRFCKRKTSIFDSVQNEPAFIKFASLFVFHFCESEKPCFVFAIIFKYICMFIFDVKLQFLTAHM